MVISCILTSTHFHTHGQEPTSAEALEMSLHAGPQNSAWADVASLILISLKFGLNRKWSHSKVHHKGKSRVCFFTVTAATYRDWFAKLCTAYKDYWVLE